MPTNPYDEMAVHYDADVARNPINSLYAMPNTLALLPDVSGLRVLDAGCGSGYYTRELVGRGARVVAVDASPRMVGLARRRVGPDAPVTRAASSRSLPNCKKPARNACVVTGLSLSMSANAIPHTVP